MSLDMKKPSEVGAVGGDVLSEGDSIEELPKRLEKYSKARKRSEETIEYLKRHYNGESGSVSPYSLDDLGPLIDSLGCCAQWMKFHHYYTVGKVRLAKIRTCKKHLLCPLCAIRRGAKSVAAYLERFKVIMAEKPKLRPYLLTLTVKNGHDLDERFSHLVKSFRTYQNRRRSYFKTGRGFNELCKAEGACFSYEVSHGKDGFHPHVHMIVMVDPANPIDFNPKRPKDSQLSKEWHDITGDSFIVDCRPICQEDPATGFVEVFKYALKMSSMETWAQVQAYFALKGKRMTGAFGCFWGVKVPESDADELLDDLPYVEMFYRYTANGYTLHHVGSSKGDGWTEKTPELNVSELDDLVPEYSFVTANDERRPDFYRMPQTLLSSCTLLRSADRLPSAGGSPDAFTHGGAAGLDGLSDKRQITGG